MKYVQPYTAKMYDLSITRILCPMSETVICHTTHNIIQKHRLLYLYEFMYIPIHSFENNTHVAARRPTLQMYDPSLIRIQ